ncbi:hypothetical protein [Rheinheimera tangshanensis]|uniref:hypothetical protein n=1 Tax=Rheinheimera tangshanensis TaxID=400153 RepID=UPI001C86C6B0|nr:hypothetical protein [Rheinheimera tangshanensis]
MASDPQFAGAYSRDTGIIYVNDAAHDDATAAVTTVGHETQHYLDNQQNPDAVQSPQYQSNREEYAGIMGNATADYLNFNFAQNNYALAGSNTHSIGGTSSEIERNLNLLLDNRVLLGQENPDSLDSCGPLCIARLQAATPVTTSPAIPGVGQNDALNQNEAAALALERGLKDFAGTLGNLGSGGTAVATLTETEVFGKQLDSFEVFDMLEVGQAYQMPDGNVVVKRGITDVSLEQPGSALLNSYEMVTPTQLGQQGGFLAPDEPVVTALPNPAPINPGLIVLDNTPPEIPGQIGGFEIGESLPSLTGTPVHEGHWSDSIYLSESGNFDSKFNKNDLTSAANKPINDQGLSEAARAWEKHAGRAGGVFEPLKGNPAQKNEAASQFVNKVLNNTNTVRTNLSRGGVEYRLPDGSGIRYDSDGSFSGFLDPKR